MHSRVIRDTPRLTARLVAFEAGDHLLDPSPMHRLILHHGPPIYAESASNGVQTPRHLQRPGDFDFIPAGCWGWWRDEAPSTVLAATLEPSAFAEAAQRLGRSPRSLRLRPWLHGRDDRIATLARLAPRQGDACDTDEAFDAGATAFCNVLASAIAVQLLTLQGAGVEPNARVRPLDARRLKAVLAYIDNHLDQPLTLDELAHQAGLRRSHFATAFRQATRYSPRQYIIRRRVQAARELLASGEASISEVAFRTGFAHQSHLSRALRKITGLTPRELAAGDASPPLAEAAGPAGTAAATHRLAPPVDRGR